MPLESRLTQYRSLYSNLVTNYEQARLTALGLSGTAPRATADFLASAALLFANAAAAPTLADYGYDAARQAGNLSLALAVYQEALARFPDFAQAYYEIAQAYRLNEQPAQAVAAIEQALTLMAPSNVNYYIRAGSICEWAGDKDQSLHAYRQALLIDPQNVVALEGVKRLGKGPD